MSTKGTEINDGYSQQIAYLTEHPGEIYYQWSFGNGLFRYAATQEYLRKNLMHCGCLTIIRHCPDEESAQTPELTAAIVADERIPKSAHDITVADLPVFAEWQRKIDAELGREPLVFELDSSHAK